MYIKNWYTATTYSVMMPCVHNTSALYLILFDGTRHPISLCQRQTCPLQGQGTVTREEAQNVSRLCPSATDFEHVHQLHSDPDPQRYWSTLYGVDHLHSVQGVH